MEMSGLGWVGVAGVLALFVLAGCTAPITPRDAGVDAFGPGLDAGGDAFVSPDGNTPTDGGVDAAADAEAIDAGTDAGMIPAALEVVGGFGTATPSTTSGGAITVVGQGFGVASAMCSGALCVVGGFSR